MTTLPLYTKGQAYEALKFAIETYTGDTGPGVWDAEDESEEGYGNNLNITYLVREDRNTPGLAEFVSKQDNAVYLEQWGGDAILASATLTLEPVQTTWGDLDKVKGRMQFLFTARVRVRLDGHDNQMH